MDRRSLLQTIVKPSSIKKNLAKAKSNTILGGGSGLNPYTGTWGYDQAKHLLRRAMIGPNLAQIKQGIQDGLTITINKLFSAKADPAPPVNSKFPNDPYCAIGQTWINSSLDLTIPNIAQYRIESIASWIMDLMLHEDVSIKEKMTLFWYNHFVTEAIFDARTVYINNKLYRQYALGNFKEFTKKVTVDPAMLSYLNGNQNTKKAPNENYARELLELFTIGKGPLVGPGDYTNYTELDVQEMAKVLTGWRDVTNELDLNNKNYSVFLPNNHNIQTKTLSNRFNNAQITNLGDKEYETLIDIIFQQPEVARFICRKLYIWFVYYKIDATIEQDIIQPMADMLIANNFEIEPVIKALLSSEHFFNADMTGCMIKSPVDYVIGAFKMLNIPTPGSSDLNKQYTFAYNLFAFSYILQQAYFYAPNVAGWKAYYQEPAFYEMWINSVTLTIRIRIMDALTIGGFPIDNTTYKMDVLEFAKTLDAPFDATSLIDELIQYLYPKDLTAGQKTYLKGILIPGLPDYVWTVAYNDYLTDPTNPTKSAPIENQLRALLYTMCDLSEFQLN
jgi:uncharacterized protein (DUF1800 family)